MLHIEESNEIKKLWCLGARNAEETVNALGSIREYNNPDSHILRNVFRYSTIAGICHQKKKKLKYLRKGVTYLIAGLFLEPKFSKNERVPYPFQCAF